MSPRALANLGAEEPEGRSRAARAALAPLESLFRQHVEADPPVFAWLPCDSTWVAWWNDEAVAAQAAAAGARLFGADPAIVRRCHDKAFAQWTAASVGLSPEPLRGRVFAVEPEDCLGARAEATCQRLGDALAREPGSAGLTLKPRIGTSGRGRLPLRTAADLDVIRSSLPRFARSGGILVEPWCARSSDLSVTLFVSESGEITLVGSAELLVTPSGVYRGHRGSVDARGRMSSGSRFDERMREAAVELARAAASVGYTGPCGVDGFVFEHAGCEMLRPVVEFNARFTIGFLVAASLRSRLAEIRAESPLRPDRALSFAFELREPEAVASPRQRGVFERELWPQDRAPETRRPWLRVAACLESVASVAPT